MEDLNETLAVANELHAEVTGQRDARPGLDDAVRDCLRELRTHDDNVAVLAHKLLAEACLETGLFREES